MGFNLKLINYYPPYIGAGIRLQHVNQQGNEIRVAMKLRWFNRNVWNVHFGGSLYAMCDPWFMFIVQNYLGTDYVVWDKAATIRFKKPGTGKVTAHFHISDSDLGLIKTQVDQGVTTEFYFQAKVINELGQIVAEVDKTVYANTKQAHKARLAQHQQREQAQS